MGQQPEIDFWGSFVYEKKKEKMMAYGLSDLQAQLITQKEKEADFDALIIDLNTKVRSGKLKMDKSVAYLVGVYQKKGILPSKN